MCLYPKLIKNPKYKSTKKNGGQVPPVTDVRVTMIPVGCGNCMECKRQKAREWSTRLLEDIKTNTGAKFITLTFSDQSIAKLAEEVNTRMLVGHKRINHKRDLKGYILDNEIATRAMRLFNERWRKEKGKAIRHWMVTEIGHKGTENIHMHGIIWTDTNRETAYADAERIWQYGHIWPRKHERNKTYVNDSTITYMTKYVSKIDQKHKTYRSIILTSAGIGANYVKSENSKRNKYKEQDTDEGYRTRTGHKVKMPIYWRNKIYTEEQREKLWLEKLDKEERWVMGERVSVKKEIDTYDKVVKHYRELNRVLGYGTDEKDEERIIYERDRRIIMQQTRIAKGKEKINAFGGK